MQVKMENVTTLNGILFVLLRSSLLSLLDQMLLDGLLLGESAV